MKVFLLVCLFIVVATCSKGIDISGATCSGSSWVSAQDFPCFVNQGKSFTVIQTWQGGYGETSAVAYCASQAHAAGLSVSLYAYACPNCSGNTPAYTVFKNLAENLKSQGVSYTYLYFDIEECPPSSCWSSSTSTNVSFLKDAISGAEDGGAKVGIYANKSSWTQIMGSDSSFSKYPLWYAHYDGSASFSDFTAFGGWTSPHMKQYNDHSDVGCYTNVDVDYM
eukprot:TRINITY_DN45901_c0_g1_i1.p1 TRINITY_DN45901_c0_g1~~TRINITY_DN45901_c0_g1_i1.p1  ORF type:complete len:233 (+),score=45.51 TRINITY_DN45901_c0_g1_i1:32-700(+)